MDATPREINIKKDSINKRIPRMFIINPFLIMLQKYYVSYPIQSKVEFLRDPIIPIKLKYNIFDTTTVNHYNLLVKKLIEFMECSWQSKNNNMIMILNLSITIRNKTRITANHTTNYCIFRKFQLSQRFLCDF